MTDAAVILLFSPTIAWWGSRSWAHRESSHPMSLLKRLDLAFLPQKTQRMLCRKAGGAKMPWAVNVEWC